LSPHVPDLAALELFVAVARYGSIGAAARHTGISQQAASARLRAMESQVGTVLLDRDPRGSRLTAAGALLVDWAAPLLAQAAELDSGIASLRRARDAQLRVAASLTIAEHLLPAWLVALRDEYEQAGRQPAEITLVAANSEAVAEHGVDLGFVEGPVPPRGLRSRVVAADRLAVVVRPDHPWARRRSPVRAAELAATPLVEREEGSGTRQSLRAALTACLGPGSQLAAPALRLSTTTAVRQAVQAGAGPAVLSLLAVRENVAAGLLAVIPVPGLDLGRRLRAVWVGAPQPPAGPARDLIGVAVRLGAPPEPG
jgi:molybdate transport repressor ModE-like protein